VTTPGQPGNPASAGNANQEGTGSMSAPNQPPADRDAAARRQSDLKAAADSLAARRNAEDEAVAQRRLAEDEKLADARTEEDRVVASARNRLAVAAAEVQAATDSVSNGGDPARLRAANAELQSALADHLAAVPEQPRTPKPGEAA
jgi:hypothetical protein